MKFSEQWLREWVNPDLSTQELADQLTMIGLEVDGVDPVAGNFSKVVVARIESAEQHPDADRLRVCTVDVGEDEALQIVCGAPNARAGLVAPLALVGGRIGDLKIKKAKLRGVESRGMLCSAKELGLSDDAAGLLELDDGAPIGADLTEYLGLDDHTIDVDLTPNRADCLGIVGIAADIAAANGLTVSPPAIEPVVATIDDTHSISLADPADCPRYLGRIIRGIDPKAESPRWMQEKLRRCGLRSISPVVDVTNYVLLELGQPMHGFDLDKLQGEIVVRRGKEGESIKLLDGKDVDINSELLLITDDSGPIALGGIMGGDSTSVQDDTKNILFECAYFRPGMIMGRARDLGMHTDASHRYERGVDPYLQHQAIERATQLLIEIAGGQAGPIVEAVDGAHLPVQPEVTLRHSAVDRLLGLHIDADRIEQILTGLQMEVTAIDGGWKVKAPSRRFDIEIEEDLIEEIARIYGFNNLPAKSLGGTMDMGNIPESHITDNRIRTALVSRDYQEVINYAFVSPDLLAQTGQSLGAISLANPLSVDMSVMRTSIFPGLLQTFVYNRHRQQSRVRIFEVGVCFNGRGEHVEEEERLALLISGAAAPEQWNQPRREIDFFDLKGDLESLVDLTRSHSSFEFQPARQPWLHPGRSAEIIRSGRTVGWIGALHPSVAQSLEIEQEVCLAEIEMSALSEGIVPNYEAVSKFPSIRRDIAVVFAEQVSFSQVKAIIDSVDEAALRGVLLFDEYRGQGVESGCKSMAMGLILQERSRTLTDEEVDTVVDSVVTKLQQGLDGRLR